MLIKNNYDTPVSEGTVYDVTIEDIGREGDGIARIHGFVVLVPCTIIGDNVRIIVEKVTKRFAIASTVPNTAALHKKKDVGGLVTTLDDANSCIRRNATYALGEIGDPRAIPALEKATNDSASSVAAMARHSLDKIKSSDAHKDYLKEQGILKKEAMGRIESSGSTMKNAEEFGCGISSVLGLLKETNIAFDNGNYEEAIEYAKQYQDAIK